MRLSLHTSQVAHRGALILVSVAWSDQEYFYSPLDRMLVYRRVTPSIKFAQIHLYTCAKRGTARGMCLAQERNTMSRARARTQTARFQGERTNHEATVPLTQNTFYSTPSKKLSSFAH